MKELNNGITLTLLQVYDPGIDLQALILTYPGITVVPIIMELDDNPRLHLAIGPPCRTNYHTYGFKNN